MPENRTPTHPGEILLHEFLIPLGISQAALARHLGIPIRHVSEIVHTKRGVEAKTAWLLAGALGTTPQFWMNLQTVHDLAKCKPMNKSMVKVRQ